MTFYQFCKGLWPEFTSRREYPLGLMSERPWAGPKDRRPNRKHRKRLYREYGAGGLL
jgi:hypothetical protein